MTTESHNDSIAKVVAELRALATDLYLRDTDKDDAQADYTKRLADRLEKLAAHMSVGRVDDELVRIGSLAIAGHVGGPTARKYARMILEATRRESDSGGVV